MNARQYFETVVLPTFERFKDESDAIELQFAATLAVFHTADYINEDRKLHDIGAGRRCITRQAPEFEAIFAAAHADKHAIIRSNPASERGLEDPHLMVPNVLHLEGVPLEWDGVQLSWGEAPHIQITDGRTFPLEEALQNVIDVLDRETATLLLP